MIQTTGDFHPSEKPMPGAYSAVVLAGAHIWREDSLDSLCPRALLPVANQPLITFVLRWLRTGGVNAATICANDAGALIQRRLTDGGEFNLDVYYYVDRMPRGPAGCCRDAAEMIQADQYVVIDGAILPTLALEHLLTTHRQQGAAATVVVNEGVEPHGEFEEHQSPAGIFVFSREVLETVSPTGYQDVKEVLIPRLHRTGAPVLAYPAETLSPRVTDLHSYLAAQGWALAHGQTGHAAFEDYEQRGDAWVHRSAEVAGDARLIGPVMIGPSSQVGQRAIIIGPAAVGAECVIEDRAVIGRSVLWDYSSLGAEARIDECLVASGVAVAGGEARHGVICRAEMLRRTV